MQWKCERLQDILSIINYNKLKLVHFANSWFHRLLHGKGNIRTWEGRAVFLWHRSCCPLKTRILKRCKFWWVRICREEVALQEVGNTCIFRRFVICAFNRHYYDIVTCILIARQRLDKQIPTRANTSNNRMSIVRQRISKHASLTIESMFPEWSVQCGYIELFASIDQYSTAVGSRMESSSRR
jgi:hypothetical protein